MHRHEDDTTKIRSDDDFSIDFLNDIKCFTSTEFKVPEIIPPQLKTPKINVMADQAIFPRKKQELVSFGN